MQLQEVSLHYLPVILCNLHIDIKNILLGIINISKNGLKNYSSSIYYLFFNTILLIFLKNVLLDQVYLKQNYLYNSKEPEPIMHLHLHPLILFHFVLTLVESL